MTPLEQAWNAACSRFRDNFPETMRTTPAEFAWRKFVQDSAGKQDHPRYPVEAPTYAYGLLLVEHKAFNDYATV